MKNRKFSFRLERPFFALLLKESKEKGCKVSQLIREILKEHYRKPLEEEGKIVPEFLHKIEYEKLKEKTEREKKQLQTLQDIIDGKTNADELDDIDLEE